MRKRTSIKLKTSFCSIAATLLLCMPSWKNSSINDIAKPHTGVYECQRATLGETDCLQEFAYIKLELLGDGVFHLYYKTKDGEKGKQSGTYVYEREKKSITFSLGENQEIKRSFLFENGEITLSLPIGFQQLNMQFERK